MSILDKYLLENKRPRIGKKKIFVTDSWPGDKTFWDRESFLRNSSNTIERFTKYHQLKNGKWSKKDVLGETVREDIFPTFMEWDEFDKIRYSL